MSDTDNKQEALNKELEAKFKEYNSSEAKSASPRMTIQKALIAYAKAGQKCREAIEAVEGYKEIVKSWPTTLDIDEIDKKLHPDQTEKLYNSLVEANYTGLDINLHIWQKKHLRMLGRKEGAMGTVRKSSSGESIFNISSPTAKATADKILSWVKSNANKTKKEIASAVSKIIRPDDFYKYIIVKDGESENDKNKKLEDKIKLIVSKLSGPSDKLKGLDELGEKLEQEKGKYKVAKVS